jgi:hypothetical protein
MISYGATLCGSDISEFRIWAPNATRVDVTVNGTEIIAMPQLTDGWFEAKVCSGAGTRYVYSFDGEGRRSAFAAFTEFEDEEKSNCTPDPNNPGTFEASIPPTVSDPKLDGDHRDWLDWTSALLKAATARGRMGEGIILEIAVNLGGGPVPYVRNVKATSTRLLFETVGAGLAASWEH